MIGWLEDEHVYVLLDVVVITLFCSGFSKYNRVTSARNKITPEIQWNTFLVHTNISMCCWDETREFGMGGKDGFINQSSTRISVSLNWNKTINTICFLKSWEESPEWLLRNKGSSWEQNNGLLFWIETCWCDCGEALLVMDRIHVEKMYYSHAYSVEWELRKIMFALKPPDIIHHHFSEHWLKCRKMFPRGTEWELCSWSYMITKFIYMVHTNSSIEELWLFYKRLNSVDLTEFS